MKAYTEKQLSDSLFERTFKDSLTEEDLLWHQDGEDRIVEVLKSNGWKLQIENELPKEMIVSGKYNIPKLTWHRVLKGSGDLIVRIFKSGDHK